MVLDKSQDLWELHLGFKVTYLLHYTRKYFTYSSPLGDTERILDRFYEAFEIKAITFKLAVSIRKRRGSVRSVSVTNIWYTY